MTGESDRIIAEATVALFAREDVEKLGNGFVMFARADESRIGPLASITIESNGEFYKLTRSESCKKYSEEQIIAHAKQLLGQAVPNQFRARLHELLERPYYQGNNTLAELQLCVHFEVDNIYFCPPRGFLILGWFLDPFGEVSRIRVRCGSSVCRVDPSTWISVRRADVVQGFAAKYGLPNDRVGFIAYVPEIHHPGESIYAEIEMRDGRIGFRPLQPAFFSGLPAIKELLGRFTLRSDELKEGFDNVFGPAVETMNAFRLLSRPDEDVLNFGAPIRSPRATIVVPLYGRVDFLEYQLAFFSQSLASDHEIIYVLDDPERRLEVDALAAACLAKFERPFTVIALAHNVGYAPANNVGLKHARGDHICFLNSDVFPGDPDWLELLIATEKSDESVGIVGALLNYEDGTLQHRGCAFERLPEFADWVFAIHPDKGRRVTLPESHGAALAVTGACMVMTRELALQLGGFDEGYVIGDFEDADLCLRAGELGLSCLVDYRAQLYHLERQSQGQSQPWRMNLTLYNAWRFQQRWRDHEF